MADKLYKRSVRNVCYYAPFSGRNSERIDSPDPGHKALPHPTSGPTQLPDALHNGPTRRRLAVKYNGLLPYTKTQTTSTTILTICTSRNMNCFFSIKHADHSPPKVI